MVNKCVFYDRDGIINDLVLHNNVLTAPWSLSEFKLKPNVKYSINLVKDLGFLTFVITNQPDVKDGLLKFEDLEEMHKIINVKYKFDEISYCLDRGSSFYKPNNMMVENLIHKYKVNRSKSFFIGDTWKDIVCGEKSKITTIFVGQKYTSPDNFKNIKPKYIVNDIISATNIIREIDLND